MPSKKLTPSQAGTLGGYAKLRKHGVETMSAMGVKGGGTTMERHGREYFIRLAHRRWGRNVEVLPQ